MNEKIEEIRKAGQITFEKMYVLKELLESQANWYKQMAPMNFLSEQEQIGKSLNYKPLINENDMRELTMMWLDSMKKVIYTSGFQSQELLGMDLVKMLKGENESKTALKEK